jgi:pantothenate kinase
MKQLKIKQQKLNGSKPGELCVMATGGGAYKYYDKIRDALGVDVLREDEMECLIIGTYGGLYLPAAVRKSTNTELQGWISSLRRFLVRCSPTVKPTPCTSRTLAQIYTRISW